MNDPTTGDPAAGPLLVPHEGHTPRERSACRWRDRPISRQDAPISPAAWAHAVDIDGARLHFHRRATELYYVVEGSGSVILDGVEQPVCRGTLVHIPPRVVYGARGRMRVLVIGIPDIAEDDDFEAPPIAQVALVGSAAATRGAVSRPARSAGSRQPSCSHGRTPPLRRLSDAAPAHPATSVSPVGAASLLCAKALCRTQ